MDIRMSFLWLILGTAVVTVLPRVLPLILLSKAQLPQLALRWLNYIPVAVLAALLGAELLLDEGRFAPHIGGLMAAALTIIAAAITRSLLAAVTVGILAMALLRWLWPAL
ncbi:AzlD domain-containing protein [Paenibacillus sp. JX-17]|uniref:AzlD domain-containing protein n=1 Tax=Paenibacillus lacisoli TaxID=3064525 RepID=A0ABT9CFN9_9BACL|nr:AzlD domain-containing protein [Paenibacillus sp. JX-17]MDO7907388.1 AzlD domain-containing protein [Paenibacillus sp. JX-17]